MGTFFAWDNYISAPSTVLAANSAEAALPVDNLADPNGAPSSAWQTQAGATTLATGALFKATPAAPAQTWRVFGLFRTNLTANAVVSFALWSNTVGGPVPVWSANVSPILGQAVAVAPVDTVADFVQVFINDGSNPDGFLNIPLAFAGPAWFPATGTGWQSTHGRDVSSAVVQARGGSQSVARFYDQRRWEIALDGVRASEVWADVDTLRLAAGFGTNVLYAPDSASADLRREAIYGLLTSTADISFPYQGADRRAWRARITERL